MKKATLFLCLLILVACGRSDETGTPAPEVDSETAETAVADSPDSPEEDNTTPAQSEAATASEDDTIILRMIAYDWEIANYSDLIESFEAENPDIAIEMVSLEETLGLSAGGAGAWPDGTDRQLVSAADVVPMNAINVTGSPGLLLDLRPLIEADSSFRKDDFYPGGLESVTRNGGIWGMPTSLNFTFIFYNKDIFDEASVAYPEAGWSWDDFVAAAQATTQRNGEEDTQWGWVDVFGGPFDLVLPRVGDNLVDASTDPPIAHVDTPEMVAALQRYADLFLLHEVSPLFDPPEPDEGGFFTPPGYALIESEQAAMWSEFSGSWAFRSQQMNLGVVPFPADEDDDSTNPVYSGSGFAVSAGTRHPEAAWRWLSFMSSQPSADPFNQDTAVPVRRSVAEASGFWERIDPELGSAIAYALEHGSYFQQFPAPVYRALSDATNAVLHDGLTVEAALADAQKAVTEALIEAAAAAEDEEPPEIVVQESETETIPAGAATIVFITDGGPGGLQPFRDLARTFRESHPDIVVDLQTPNFGASAISLRDVMADADCAQWFGGIEDEANRAMILNMEPFLDADAAISKDEYYQTAVDAFTYQGQLFGLPAEINIPVIVYNKALFDAANVPYPTSGWTTDDFLTTAVALTEGDDPETKQYGYVPQDFETNDIVLLMERLGAEYIDESQDPPRLTLDNPATVAAMRWLTSLTTEYAVKPTFNTDIGNSVSFGEERQALIENGRAAMWSDQGFDSFPETNLSRLNIGVAPLPTGVDGTAVLNGGLTGYFISAQTEQRQACWEWIKFLSEQPYLASYGNTVPARRSVAQSPAYAQAIGDSWAAANLANVENVTKLSVSSRFDKDLGWMALGHFWWQSYAYNQILTADVSVEEAMSAVQARSDAYRDCLIDNNGFNDDAIQRTCLGEVDADIPAFWIEVDE